MLLSTEARAPLIILKNTKYKAYNYYLLTIIALGIYIRCLICTLIGTLGIHLLFYFFSMCSTLRLSIVHKGIIQI